MRSNLSKVVFAALLIAAASPAAAQNPPRGQAPARPYKAVAITPPQPMNDPSFDALRKQIGDIARKKDRAALAKLVVGEGFFWDREKGNAADKRKSGIDNLAAALGLANKDGAGWDMLIGYSEDPTASPSAEYKNAVCAPADPGFNGAEFEALLKTTETDLSEWGYPVSATIEVHATPQASAPVIDRLGLAFVRVAPEGAPASAAYMRIVTPGGKTGYVSVDAVAPIGNDRICYVKDAGGWKIGGYVGGGDAL